MSGTYSHSNFLKCFLQNYTIPENERDGIHICKMEMKSEYDV